ncbi:MAG: dihydropteroate synthase [Clostridia bacterium]|nr:dihydropteroate synthase [Clostridia bacterium]
MKFKAGKHIIDCDKHTCVMGILNITPDSFSDGGKYFTLKKAVERAFEIEAEGADIIDIGAFSTRPGHTEISVSEEEMRLLPLLEELNGRLEIPVSVDTFNIQTAQAALCAGADIINDVSGTVSPQMAEIVKKHGAGWIIMHNGGAKTDIISDVNEFFRSAVKKCESLGIDREHISLDCGFGFGKKHDENYRLLANFDRLDRCGCTLTAALSRKRMLGEINRRSAPYRTEETITADTAAILFSANIIRVHDVCESVFSARTADEIKKYREV